MSPDSKNTLKHRVAQAAEAALADHGYVSLIDLFTGTRLLSPSHVESWRKGRIEFLAPMIQGSPEKIASSQSLFLEWTREKGLQPRAARYTRAGRNGPVDLRFNEGGDPAIEKSCRIHFVSPALSGRKLEKLEEKAGEAPRPVVFEMIRDSECTE